MSSNYDGKRPIGAFSSLQVWNTYSWINNEAFYGLVPQSYQDFYNRFVKQWFYWYDGFVPYFHNSQSGMVSTRLAYAILKKLAEKTVGSKLLFDDEGYEDEHSININGKELNSVEFVEHWSKKNDLTSTIKQAYEWAYAGGDSILKHDTNGKDLFVSVIRKDNYLIDTDFSGQICKMLAFIYSYTKTIANDEKEHYYLVEEREYVDEVPKFRIAVKKNTGTVTNGKSVDLRTETIPFDRLPNDIKRKFKKDYPNMVLGEWQDMPFKDLGVYLVKATKKVSFLPDAPFGESLLSPLIHLLMTYDFYFSSLTTNLYTTRDKVLLPESMQTPHNQKPDDFYSNQANWFGGMDSYLYNRLPYVDPENQKPIFIQPQLRNWNEIRNTLLQTVAMTLGVDERTITSSIVPNAEKPTAREISVDEDTTASFIQEKRELNRNAFNQSIENLLYFYGFTSEIVTLSFSRAGLSNINNVTTIATLLKQNGLGDLKSLLQIVWQDKSDRQIEQMISAIEEEQEKAREYEMKKNEQQGVEEKMEQQNNDTEYHVPRKENE
jgi:hypothetical protein